MKVIVGLGNPGEKYDLTRHNVGFKVLDRIVDTLTKKIGTPLKKSQGSKFNAEVYSSSDWVLVKPLTFMNQSGLAAASVLKFYDQELYQKIQNYGKQSTDQTSVLEKMRTEITFFVIHDDLDLELGTYKIQFGRGPKIHNGLLSLYSHLHGPHFWHVRIGVDSRQGDRTMPGQAYVLQKFSRIEETKLEPVIAEVLTKLLG